VSTDENGGTGGDVGAFSGAGAFKSFTGLTGSSSVGVMMSAEDATSFQFCSPIASAADTAQKR